jgi:hypothetical protein
MFSSNGSVAEKKNVYSYITVQENVLFANNIAGGTFCKHGAFRKLRRNNTSGRGHSADWKPLN